MRKEGFKVNMCLYIYTVRVSVPILLREWKYELEGGLVEIETPSMHMLCWLLSKFLTRTGTAALTKQDQVQHSWLRTRNLPPGLQQGKKQ